MPIVWISKETYTKRKELRSSNKYGEWKSKVKERDFNKCRLCNKNNIEVHHIKSFKRYKRLRYKVSNGICLCQQCHKKIHKYQDFIKTL